MPANGAADTGPGTGAELAFLYPGALETPTGGYVYDRQLLAALCDIGIQVDARSLGEGYPAPAPRVLAGAERMLAGLPDGQAVMIDGLAFGVMADVARPHAERLRLVALVHHPLAHESGIPAARAAELLASERAALALARHVVTTSHATAAALAGGFKVPSGKITVLEPGLTVQCVKDRSPCDHDDGGPLRLLAVGSLIPRKDYPTLLAAIARLSDRALRLDIVGSAAFDPACAAGIEAEIGRLGLGARVRLHGALEREALDALYAQADIFTLTTLYEGYGMAFAEAMAHGLPVIATGEGAVRDTVPPPAGMVLAAGGIGGGAGGIARLCGDAGLG
ncbi:glycosyltransferase family 4 protein, partial [Stappia sp.]|uniref:glycosyltransferase family 4 protein n=1 Tax=Stappia sp. TaxID=1870903 RepID=UPI003A98F164